MTRSWLALLTAVALCGCGDAETASKTAAANAVAPAGFRPPAERSATPLPGLAQITPLSAYVGKYPSDVVDGVGFFDRTEVATALRDAIGDEAVRRRFTARGATEVPIFAGRGRIAAHACEQGDCAAHNWTLFVSGNGGGDGRASEACYHDAATMGTSSHWYSGAAPATRPGDCPAG